MPTKEFLSSINTSILPSEVSSAISEVISQDNTGLVSYDDTSLIVLCKLVSEKFPEAMPLELDGFRKGETVFSDTQNKLFIIEGFDCVGDVHTAKIIDGAEEPTYIPVSGLLKYRSASPDVLMAKGGEISDGDRLLYDQVDNLNFLLSLEEDEDKREAILDEISHLNFLVSIGDIYESDSPDKPYSISVRPEYKYQNSAKKSLDDLSPRQLKVVLSMLAGFDPMKITEDMGVAQEARFYGALSSRLGLFEGNDTLSSAYNSKSLGSFVDEISRRVNEMYELGENQPDLDDTVNKIILLDTPGKIITFRERFYPEGQESKKGVIRIPSLGLEYSDEADSKVRLKGTTYNSPWYDDISLLIEAVDWDWMGEKQQMEKGGEIYILNIEDAEAYVKDTTTSESYDLYLLANGDDSDLTKAKMIFNSLTESDKEKYLRFINEGDAANEGISDWFKKIIPK